MKKILTLLSSAFIAAGAWAQNMENGHEYVDLGLTSGTKWATCNVGADAPESYGDYYAWGEVTTHYSAGGNTDSPTWKDGYSAGYNWSTYKYMDHSKDSWEGCTKYTFADGQTSGVWYDSEGNFIGDNKRELDDADDVAVQTWGGAWKMPTKGQQDELRNECDWEWTSINGVNGYKVKSRVNDNFIFLPAAGYRWFTDLGYAGDAGRYWSRSLYTDGSDSAYGLLFRSGVVSYNYNNRDNGFSVRPVFMVESTPTAIESINADKAQKVIKTIENGKVVIIRNGEKFDLSGRKL
ncbi:MAG: hypothetical protein MJZ01_07590 [Bacteroidales bacterium]|nr:hypothetical protein [Bacteroidales bacterium]